MIDNSIQIYLASVGREIEKRNNNSDNKKYHINKEKLEVLSFLVSTKKILEIEIKAASKIIGVKTQ